MLIERPMPGKYAFPGLPPKPAPIIAIFIFIDVLVLNNPEIDMLYKYINLQIAELEA